MDLATLVSLKPDAELIKLVRHIKSLEEDAWDAVIICRVNGKDDQFPLGRAHALAEILGDQEALSRMGAFAT